MRNEEAPSDESGCAESPCHMPEPSTALHGRYSGLAIKHFIKERSAGQRSKHAHGEPRTWAVCLPDLRFLILYPALSSVLGVKCTQACCV